MATELEARSPYQYRPLHDGEIRVLYIKPSGNEYDPIECMLLHGVPETINECTRPKEPLWPGETPSPPSPLSFVYGALSYAWGPTASDGSHMTDTIVCEDQALKVTANLHSTLRLIRKRIPLREPYPPPSKDLNYYHDAIPMVYPIWIDAICINQHDVQERSQQVRMMYEIYSSAFSLLVWLGDMSSDESSLMVEVIKSSAYNSNWTKESAEALSRFLKQPWFSRRW